MIQTHIEAIGGSGTHRDLYISLTYHFIYHLCITLYITYVSLYISIVGLSDTGFHRPMSNT